MCRRGPERRMQGSSRVVNRARAHIVHYQDSPGTRLFSQQRTSASAPIVTSTKATRLDGPSGARTEGSANTPVPMIEPTTRGVAAGSPYRIANAPPAAFPSRRARQMAVPPLPACQTSAPPQSVGPQPRYRLSAGSGVCKHAPGQDPPERSPDWLSVGPAVPTGLKVLAGWVIRRWQPGQSAEGGLLAGGQYTNLSVRQ